MENDHFSASSDTEHLLLSLHLIPATSSWPLGSCSSTGCIHRRLRDVGSDLQTDPPADLRMDGSVWKDVEEEPLLVVDFFDSVSEFFSKPDSKDLHSAQA